MAAFNKHQIQIVRKIRVLIKTPYEDNTEEVKDLYCEFCKSMNFFPPWGERLGFINRLCCLFYGDHDQIAHYELNEEIYYYFLNVNRLKEYNPIAHHYMTSKKNNKFDD